MIAAIRRYRLVVISLAIIGLAAGFGLSGSGSRHIEGYQSKSILHLQRGVQVHSMRKLIGSSLFWRNVAGQRPYRMYGAPAWITMPGPANELKAQITTQPVSGRVFTITATEPAPHLAAIMVRDVTLDFAYFDRPGSKIWLRVLTYATNPVAVSSGGGSSPVESGSIGFGAGLGLGLLLASALAAFPGRKHEAAAE
jgi:hypothetical protein